MTHADADKYPVWIINLRNAPCDRVPQFTQSIKTHRGAAGWAAALYLNVREKLLAQQETDGGTMRWRGKKLRGGGFHFLGTQSAESLGPISRAKPVNHCKRRNTCHEQSLSPPGGPASPREPVGHSCPAHTGPPCPSPSPGCPGSAPCSGTRTPPHAPAGRRAGGREQNKEGEGGKSHFMNARGLSLSRYALLLPCLFSTLERSRVPFGCVHATCVAFFSRPELMELTRKHWCEEEYATCFGSLTQPRTKGNQMWLFWAFVKTISYHRRLILLKSPSPCKNSLW